MITVENGSLMMCAGKETTAINRKLTKWSKQRCKKCWDAKMTKLHNENIQNHKNKLIEDLNNIEVDVWNNFWNKNTTNGKEATI